MPFAISTGIASAVLSTTYITALMCQLSDPLEIFASIFAGAFVFTAEIGGSTKNKLLLASGISGVLYFIPSGIFRSICIGLVFGYSHTLAEIYAVHISVRAFRHESVSYVNTLISMQVCLCFFCLSFPVIDQALSEPVFMVGVTLLQMLTVFFLLPAPPCELVREDKRNSSLIYGEVYKELAWLFKGAPFTSFHEEYSELVEIDGGKTDAFRTRLWAVFEKLSTSFLVTAILGIISISPKNTYKLVVFSVCPVFCWLYANKAHEKRFEMSVAALCILLLLVVLLFNIQPVFAVFLACSIYMTPSVSGYMSLDARVIILSNMMRYLLASGIFFFLAKIIYVDV